MRDEFGDGEYLYSKGAEEDERKAEKEEEDVIDNRLSTPPDAR